MEKRIEETEFKDLIFNLGWMKLIAWYSVILFLVDFAERTGKWWFHLIALFFVITSFGALVIEFLKDKHRYFQSKGLKTK